MIILLNKLCLTTVLQLFQTLQISLDPFLNNIQFTPLEVQGVLETLELGKSTGPDNVNNRVLKELSAALSNPLCDLFNTSMSKSLFPDIWKEANVSALHKNDDPSLVSNYRPISLLSALGKVIEKIWLTSF